MNATLASARAYWRLAAKARRAGNRTQADHYQAIGDRKAEWKRNRDYLARIKR